MGSGASVATRSLALAVVVALVVPATGWGALIAGFVRLERGSVQITSPKGQRAVKGPASTPIGLDALLQTDATFEGSLLLFDGSRYAAHPSMVLRVGRDGIHSRTEAGWPLVHGYLVPLNGTNLNGTYSPAPLPGVPWEAAGSVVVHTSEGPQAPTTSGKLGANDLIRTAEKAIAKVDAGGRGVVVLRGATSLRRLPGGFSLERGGVMVHLGSSEETGLWTGRVRARAVRAFLEVSSVGGRDSFRIVRGRVVFTPTYKRGRARAVGPGMLVVVDAAGDLTVKRFKSRGETSKIYKDLMARLRKPLAEGFPRFVDRAYGRTAAPPPAPVPAQVASVPTVESPVQQPVSPRSEPSLPRPGPPPGQDREGSGFLDPMRTKLPGEHPGDWATDK